MDKDKALKIIKALIDESIKKGIVANLETAVAVAQAYEILAKKENE